jgi:hypothetical protein
VSKDIGKPLTTVADQDLAGQFLPDLDPAIRNYLYMKKKNQSISANFFAK